MSKSSAPEWKWRFSLKWPLLIAILISHLYFSWRLHGVRQEVRAFEVERDLTPSDGQRLTLSEIDFGQESRWRLFGEKAALRELMVHVASEEIDRWPRKDKVTSSPVKSPIIYPLPKDGLPRFEIEARLERTEKETRIHGFTGMFFMVTFPADHPLHQRPLEELVVETLPQDGSSRAADTPRLLLRITDPQTPNRGLVMWIDDA